MDYPEPVFINGKEASIMFTVQDRVYSSLSQLTYRDMGKFSSQWRYGGVMTVYVDIYWRKVVHFRERFPCFDFFDRMYEDRYFHWYIVEGPKGYSQVYAEDDNPKITVTDLSELPQRFREDVLTAFSKV